MCMLRWRRPVADFLSRRIERERERPRDAAPAMPHATTRVAGRVEAAWRPQVWLHVPCMQVPFIGVETKLQNQCQESVRGGGLTAPAVDGRMCVTLERNTQPWIFLKSLAKQLQPSEKKTDMGGDHATLWSKMAYGLERLNNHSISSASLNSTDVQILCFQTFVVGNQLTLQCKISDNKVESKGSARLCSTVFPCVYAIWHHSLCQHSSVKHHVISMEPTYST